MSHEVSECLNCAVKQLDCDKEMPRCNACLNSSSECSYDWSLCSPSFYRMFLRSRNYNDRVQPFPCSSWIGGRFGSDYQCRLTDGTPVALKVLFQSHTKLGPTAFRISLREAWKWSNLRHPNIVPFLGVADFSNVCYDGLPQICLLSTWIPGGNIMQYMVHTVEADRRSLLLDVIEGVEYLHSLSVVHGGIRGANIVVDVQRGRPSAMLRDFGHQYAVQTYAAEYETQSANPPRPAYRWMAFEHMVPSKFGFSGWEASLTPASDVFELMRAFLEILSGRPPYFDVEQDRLVPFTTFRFINPERPPDSHAMLDDNMWRLMQGAWSLELRDRPGLWEIKEYLVSLS